MNITKEQFEQYEEVRESGEYNVLDPRARAMTDLTEKEWIEIVIRYNKLKEMYGE